MCDLFYINKKILGKKKCLKFWIFYSQKLMKIKKKSTYEYIYVGIGGINIIRDTIFRLK